MPHTPPDRSGGRPALPRAPSLPGAAALAATRRGGRPLRVRPLGLGPVRPDRRDRPQPRSRPAVTRRGLPARGDRAAAVRRAGGLRDVQQGPLAGPDRRAAVVSPHLGPGPRGAPRRRVRRARTARGGAPRADPLRRPDERDRRRAAGHDRLVLAADEPGPRDPRGARGGGRPRDRPAGRQPARLRPRRAPLPGGVAGANARPRTSSNGTACSAATGRTASWEPAARPSCGSGPPAARRNGRCDAPS